MTLLILLFSSTLLAQTSDKCGFEIKCKEFNLNFKSPSGDYAWGKIVLLMQILFLETRIQ